MRLNARVHVKAAVYSANKPQAWHTYFHHFSTPSRTQAFLRDSGVSAQKCITRFLSPEEGAASWRDDMTEIHSWRTAPIPNLQKDAGLFLPNIYCIKVAFFSEQQQY